MRRLKGGGGVILVSSNRLKRSVGLFLCIKKSEAPPPQLTVFHLKFKKYRARFP